MSAHTLPAELMTFLSRRKRMRDWLAAGDFDALEAELEALLAQHLASCDLYRDYHLCLNLDYLFDHPVCGFHDCLAHLDAWQRAAPRSYHQALYRCLFWGDASRAIRGGGWASEVSAARWVGAALARDMAFACALQAIELHQRPVYALRQMMSLSASLREPDWLLDLVRGNPPRSYRDIASEYPEEQWQDGLTLFAKYSENLPEPIAALPSRLPARQPHELEDGKTYWLLRGLEAHPNDVGLLNDYLYYLYPRWGGSHEEMQAYIDGPLCAGLTEHARNHLKITKELDILDSASISPDDVEGFAYVQGLIQQLLALDLDHNARAALYQQQARFLAYTAKDPAAYRLYLSTDGAQGSDQTCTEQAYLCMAQSIRSMSGVDVLSDPSDFETLCRVTFMFGQVPDTEHLWPCVLSRAEAELGYPGHLALAATGRQFGRFGMAIEQSLVSRLLDRAVVLAQAMDYDLSQLARNLWNGGLYDEAVFLLQAGYERDHPGMTATLSDLYKGRWNEPGTPVYDDPARSLQLMERSAELGNATAMHNFALHLQTEADKTGMTPTIYQRLKALNQRAYETELQLFSQEHLLILQMLHGDDAECREALDHRLPLLWRNGDDRQREYAAYYGAYACYYGKGCTQNMYLAKVWIDRALAYGPQDGANIHLANSIYQRDKTLGALNAKIRFARDRGKVDERMQQLTFGYGETDGE